MALSQRRRLHKVQWDQYEEMKKRRRTQLPLLLQLLYPQMAAHPRQERILVHTEQLVARMPQ